MDRENYLIPIMQRHWDTHCKNKDCIVTTEFDVDSGACQLLSNKEDKLLLNIALDQPQDYECLCRFKQSRFYTLFRNDNNIFALEFGGLTDIAIQITQELLTNVFDVSINNEIELLDFSCSKIACKEINNEALLQTIVHKIVMGVSEWSNEELQFQYNNPKLLESELEKYCKSGPIDTIVSSARVSVLERSCIYKSSPQIKNIISKPNAAVLALYSNVEVEQEVAIIVIENSYFDIAIYDIGDGVFEAQNLCSGNVDGDLTNVLKEIVTEFASIKEVIVVSNESVSQNVIFIIESIFRLSAIINNNLNELLTRGAFILSAIRNGRIKDCLLLPAVANTLYCETIDGEIFNVIEKGNIYPVRNCIELTISNGSRFYIKEDIGIYKPLIAVIQLKDNATDSYHRVNVEFDFDGRGLRIAVNDIDTGESYKILV